MVFWAVRRSCLPSPLCVLPPLLLAPCFPPPLPPPLVNPLCVPLFCVPVLFRVFLVALNFPSSFWIVWKRGTFFWHFGLSSPKYVRACHYSAEQYLWCDKSALSTRSLHIRHLRFKNFVKMHSFSMLCFNFRDFRTLTRTCHLVLLFCQLSRIYWRHALFLFRKFAGTWYICG